MEKLLLTRRCATTLAGTLTKTLDLQLLLSYLQVLKFDVLDQI
jgi:hypothetical protein